MPKSEIEALTIQDLIERMQRIGLEMADQQIDHILKEFERVVTEVGNVTSRRPDESHEDYYLRTLEKIDIEFSDSGNPELPTIIAGPEAADRLNEALNVIRSTPEYWKRYVTILERKMEAWRVREADRKLVD